MTSAADSAARTTAAAAVNGASPVRVAPSAAVDALIANAAKATSTSARVTALVPAQSRSDVLIDDDVTQV